jgi:hypothetical protein
MAADQSAGRTQGPSDEGADVTLEFPMLIAGRGPTGLKRIPEVNVDRSWDVTVVSAPAVTGSVSISNFPATQPVSGTVTADQGLKNGAGTASWPVQGAAAHAAPAAGNPVLCGMWDGANVRNLISSAADAQSAGSTLGANPMLWNGVSGAAGSLDRQRNNVETTLLVSAGRTTTQTSADITTYNCQAITVTLDMTVVAAGPSVTVTIDGKDPASGKYYNLLTGAAVIAVTTNTYRVDPALVAAANLIAVLRLPRTIRIVVTANVANNGTYSVGYTLHSGGG